MTIIWEKIPKKLFACQEKIEKNHKIFQRKGFDYTGKSNYIEISVSGGMAPALSCTGIIADLFSDKKG